MSLNQAIDIGQPTLLSLMSEHIVNSMNRLNFSSDDVKNWNLGGERFFDRKLKNISLVTKAKKAITRPFFHTPGGFFP